MSAAPEVAAVPGVRAQVAMKDPLGPPWGTQPSPVWLPVPVKIGGPRAENVQVFPWSVERATNCKI